MRSGDGDRPRIPADAPDWGRGARAVLAAVREERRLARVRLARALDRVERVELVRLLVEAAARRLADHGVDEGAEPLPWVGRWSRRRHWRARARTCLWLGLARGGDDPALDLLASLCDRDRRAWPAASDLLSAGRRLQGGPVLAHLEASALAHEGRLEEARALLVEGLARDPGARGESRALEGLAAVHGRAGRPRTALAALATVRAPGVRPWPRPFHPVALAAGLGRALALGSLGDARRLAAALEGPLGARPRLRPRCARAVASVPQGAAPGAGPGLAAPPEGRQDPLARVLALLADTAGAASRNDGGAP